MSPVDTHEQRRQKGMARSTLGNAIQKGLIQKQPCSICGSTEGVEGHHDDYSKPYDVVWMCKPCHCKHHRGKRGSYGPRKMRTFPDAYTSCDLANICGVSRHTILLWERNGQIPEATRSGNKRIWNREQMQKIKKMVRGTKPNDAERGE
jgi:hypothetical protein